MCSAKKQLEAARAAVEDAEVKLEYYLEILEKNRAFLADKGPDVLSRLEETVQLHRNRLAKVQLAYEMKKGYAVEVLKMTV